MGVTLYDVYALRCYSFAVTINTLPNDEVM